MNKALAASGIFIIFVLFGGTWVWLIRYLNPGLTSSIAIVALGICLVAIFIWLLTTRLREILAGTDHLGRSAFVIAVDLLLLLLAFAASYQELGLIDNSIASKPTVHEFGTSLYHSIATFTTLGYGDYFPTGVGRILAAMEALTGYVILGIVASTSVSILSSKSDRES
ncbi:MAG TPA: potassium channel family protein [Longimicrobiaceae bacterium]|nr:potassium channel family protein [Longimicrobiaceae bacterium]